MKRTKKLASGGVQGAERPRTSDWQGAARSDQGWRQQWGGDCNRAGRWLPRGRGRTAATQCATSVGLRGGGDVSVCVQHRSQPRAARLHCNAKNTMVDGAVITTLARPRGNAVAAEQATRAQPRPKQSTSAIGAREVDDAPDGTVPLIHYIAHTQANARNECESQTPD